MGRGALRSRQAPLLRQGNRPVRHRRYIQGNDGRGRLWYQLCFSLLPGLTADGRENRLELRPDLRAEGLTHLLSSLAARTDLGRRT